MTTAIIVDSAASLPAEMVERYGIRVVPMNVIIDGRSRPDMEVPVEELLRCLERGVVSTSGPSPGAWAEAIADAREHADEVLALTVSAEMSSTYQAARIGAGAASGPVRIVDTRSAAGGEGLVTLAAARLVERGSGADEIARSLDEVIPRVHLMATLDSLEHLVHSGRVPNLVGAAAHPLRVNPLFEFHQGHVRSLRPAIGKHAAEQRIVHSCLSSRPRDVVSPTLHAAVLEAAAPERAEALRTALLAEVPTADIFVGSFGPVMLVHVGPGLVGLAWWWEP